MTRVQPQLLPEHHRGDLRHQLLARIRLAAKGAKLAVEPRLMPGGMRQLVQRRAVIIRLVAKGLSLRQVDSVVSAPIVRPVDAVIVQRDARLTQQLLRTLHRIPLKRLLRQGRDAVHLLGIEYRRIEYLRPLQLPPHRYGLAVCSDNRLALVIKAGHLLMPLPILHRHAVLALADRIPQIPRLIEGHPARIGVAAHGEKHIVDTPVGLTADRVGRTRIVIQLPRFTPGRRALLQLLHQPGRNLLMIRLAPLCGIPPRLCLLLLCHNLPFLLYVCLIALVEPGL